jgi:hypothetical protein
MALAAKRGDREWESIYNLLSTFRRNTRCGNGAGTVVPPFRKPPIFPYGAKPVSPLEIAEMVSKRHSQDISHKVDTLPRTSLPIIVKRQGSNQAGQLSHFSESCFFLVSTENICSMLKCCS